MSGRSKGFPLREYTRLCDFFEDMFRKRGWNLKASICDVAESYARWMLMDCVEKEGPIKIGTMVKFVGEAPDNGASYEQPVLKTFRVTYETPEDITPCSSEMIWNYFQFVIDAAPRNRITDEEIMSKYFQFVINGAPKNNKAITHGEVVCNYFQFALDRLTGAKERFRSLADRICVQWYDKDWRPICIGLHEPPNLAELHDEDPTDLAPFQDLIARLKKEDQDWTPKSFIQRYYKLEPVSVEEKKNLLANGLTPEKDPEAFEPLIILLDESTAAIVENFKLRHGRPPSGIFPCTPEVPDDLVVENRYPIEVFDGTFIGEWVKIANKANFIPPEFFAESLKTFVGAIAGHRIVDEEAPTQENRFYTVLLSTEGGIGKSTAVQWTQELLSFSGLIYRSRLPRRIHIGASCEEFASGRAMLECFETQPRVIQVYDELAVFVEKIGITGSGGNLLGTVNTMYDSNVPPISKLKGAKERSATAPKECHNSILACSITDKWNVMFSGAGSENSGFFQRLNIIASDETRTVGKLRKPVNEISELALQIFKKLDALEYQKVVIRDTEEATAVFERWFEQFKEKMQDADDVSDVRGRLQVLCQRNKNILAWALDDSPVPETGNVTGHPETRIVEADADVIERAIKLTEYQLLARRNNQPVTGKTDWVLCENHIIKVLKTVGTITRKELYRKIHGDRYGIKVFSNALKNLRDERYIAITTEGKTRPAEMIEWVAGRPGHKKLKPLPAPGT